MGIGMGLVPPTWFIWDLVHNCFSQLVMASYPYLIPGTSYIVKD